jgi:hypothetical protein
LESGNAALERRLRVDAAADLLGNVRQEFQAVGASQHGQVGQMAENLAIGLGRVVEARDDSAPADQLHLSEAHFGTPGPKPTRSRFYRIGQEHIRSDAGST